MSELFSHDAEFNRLRSGRDDVDLIAILIELARDAYPDLDAAACRREIERLQTAAMQRLQAGRRKLPTRDQLSELSELLYRDEGFHGNRDEYYDPRNSYLNEVLRRRTGIPITLGILYMAVAAGADLHVYGVPTPGHFMLGATANDEQWYIDPFSGGDVFDQAGCRRRVAEMTGQADQAAAAALEPASSLAIVVRVLRNLKAAHAMADQWAAALPVQQRLVALLPDLEDEQRDLGLIYLRSGHPHDALLLLHRYLDGRDDEQTQMLEPYLRTARRMAAELN